jgi:hypothetical protein
VNKGLTILVDDCKNFGGMDIICRNGMAAIAVLTSLNEAPELVLMDHDLGDGPDGKEVTERILARERDLWPVTFQMVSMNPDGVKRIEGVLKDHGYEKQSGTPNWTRKV